MALLNINNNNDSNNDIIIASYNDNNVTSGIDININSNFISAIHIDIKFNIGSTNIIV